MALPLLLLVGILAFFWKVGGQVAEEAAGGIAARIVKGARTTWCRLTRRLTKEEETIIKHTRSICERLELKGFVKEHLIVVSLESVYIPLTTQGAPRRGESVAGMPLLRTTEEAGTAPLTSLIGRFPRLVLVGEAGSGKTTFLKHIALSAANACAGRETTTQKWHGDEPPLPIVLPLHGFGLYLTDQRKADRASPNPELLRDYIIYHLRHVELPDGWVVQRLKAGDILVLLDGLDEVARFEDRRFIAELVTRFSSFYDRCQVVVTTRPQGYEGAAQLGGDFERRDINPLDWPDDIRAFLYRWNEAISEKVEGGPLSIGAQQQAHENAESLMTRLEVASGVRRLANNPLLLTVMAIVHYNVGTLPERRADLYNAATELLLGWDKRMGREALAPPPWLDALTAVQRRLPLEHLALDFQERRVIEQPRDAVLDFLADYYLAGEGAAAEEKAHSQAQAYLAWVSQRTYVLQDIGGRIRFYRKPFQEYLAARGLARQPDLKGQVRAILADDWQDRWWDETLLLAVGQLISDDPRKANDLLTFVCELDDPPSVPHYNVTFVARALADVPAGLSGQVWKIKERVTETLMESVSAVDPAFTPKARLEAGIALGKLGDVRPGVGKDPVTGLPDIVWVEIPAGSFLMGSTDAEVERWKDWTRQKVEEGAYSAEDLTKEELLEVLWAWLEAERGQHSLRLPAFSISRYPVTNAQYQCFVEDGGYDFPAWWGGEESPGWAWRQGEPRYEWQRNDRPDFWHDPRFNGPAQPVVGVTWYEAQAYCRWLSEKLSRTVRLPTEAEWERAARGTDGRAWPWGSEWVEDLINVAETELKQTSPAGILPGGDSSDGVADVAGNVWEWTLSLWGTDWRQPDYEYPYDPEDGREDSSPGDEVRRVVRGGSWYGIREFARCAVRGGGNVDLSDTFFGFRCVSPGCSDS
jgi:formylglycine-generating enzyme required for sulfatase activity